MYEEESRYISYENLRMENIELRQENEKLRRQLSTQRFTAQENDPRINRDLARPAPIRAKYEPKPATLPEKKIKKIEA